MVCRSRQCFGIMSASRQDRVQCLGPGVRKPEWLPPNAVLPIGHNPKKPGGVSAHSVAVPPCSLVASTYPQRAG